MVCLLVILSSSSAGLDVFIEIGFQLFLWCLYRSVASTFFKARRMIRPIICSELTHETMRTKLARLNGKTGRFMAVAERFSGFSTKSFRKTLLLTDVRLLNGDAVADHIWVKCGSWSRSLNAGDTFYFRASVHSYKKEYRRGRQRITELEYGFQYVKDILVIQPSDERKICSKNEKGNLTVR